MTDEIAESKVYTLKLSGPDMTLEREVNEDTLNRVMGALFQPAEESTLGRTEVPKYQPAGVQNDLTLREFINEVNPSSKPQLITTIAYYVSEHEKATKFTREDVKGRFAEAKEKMPGNFDRDFGVAQSNGWIAQDGKESKNYYMTGTGIRAVTEGFTSIKKSGSK
jgi:hypothetical protein